MLCGEWERSFEIAAFLQSPRLLSQSDREAAQIRACAILQPSLRLRIRAETQKPLQALCPGLPRFLIDGHSSAELACSHWMFKDYPQPYSWLVCIALWYFGG